MINADVKLFMEALQKAECSVEGPSLRVRIKYRGDESTYDEWPPNELRCIKDDGLMDPGFGSGPVSYSSIESMSVPSVLARNPKSEGYALKYKLLADAVSSIPGVCISLESINFNP